MTDGSRLGSLSITVTRPDPQVALIEAASPSYRELFYVVAGERMLTVTAYDATDVQPARAAGTRAAQAAGLGDDPARRAGHRGG